MGVSPTAPEQAEPGSAAGLVLLRVTDLGLLQLCHGTSPSYFRQPKFAESGAAQEPPATFLG